MVTGIIRYNAGSHGITAISDFLHAAPGRNFISNAHAVAVVKYLIARVLARRNFRAMDYGMYMVIF